MVWGCSVACGRKSCAVLVFFLRPVRGLRALCVLCVCLHDARGVAMRHSGRCSMSDRMRLLFGTSFAWRKESARVIFCQRLPPSRLCVCP